MTDSVSFLTLFLLGFFGGGHCVGMCGGLSSAFALQLPPHIGRDAGHLCQMQAQSPRLTQFDVCQISCGFRKLAALHISIKFIE